MSFLGASIAAHTREPLKRGPEEGIPRPPLQAGTMLAVRVKKAVQILKQGGLVAFPTETVYGLGARVFDPVAIRRIFTVKGRPFDNPLIVHVTGPEQVASVASETPPIALRLMENFWPGPLTLVLKRAPCVPPEVSAGLDTIAVRSPDHPIARALLRELGEPIAAPSANRSGRPSPTRASHVVSELGNEVDMVLDGGPCRIGLESTVLDLTGQTPCILRPGAVTAEALYSIIGSVVLSPGVLKGQPVRSPGLKHRHYAPDFKMVLVPPDGWPFAIDQWMHSGKRVGVLCQKGKIPKEGLVFVRRIKDGSKAYARTLFCSLRDAEAAGVEVLLTETVEEKGLGIAVMDRLKRAAGGKGEEDEDIHERIFAGGS